MTKTFSLPPTFSSFNSKNTPPDSGTVFRELLGDQWTVKQFRLKNTTEVIDVQ